MSSLGTVLTDYNEDTQTCQVAAGLNFRISYAEMGFSANPQKYIIKVEKSVQAIDWKYTQSYP